MACTRLEEYPGTDDKAALLQWCLVVERHNGVSAAKAKSDIPDVVSTAIDQQHKATQEAEAIKQIRAALSVVCRDRNIAAEDIRPHMDRLLAVAEAELSTAKTEKNVRDETAVNKVISRSVHCLARALSIAGDARKPADKPAVVASDDSSSEADLALKARFGNQAAKDELSRRKIQKQIGAKKSGAGDKTARRGILSKLPWWLGGKS